MCKFDAEKTPLGAFVGLLPIPSSDKGGGLGMGLEIPLRKTTTLLKKVTSKNLYNHINSALRVG
uniref:SJCHGC03027 protein n=1 Tax=Schistosoma japonicum TaxID=6182 RepID=Q5BT00_SCHJA|nr:SJCHGC03027 protein [Schistosoma japonicum]